KQQVMKTLDNSSTLHKAYEETLQRIEHQPDDDRALAKKVLSWLLFAKRPLTIAEICCALAVEPGETELNPDDVPDLEDLVSVCAGLVVIEHESGIIRLVHHSTQDFFEINGQWLPSAELDITSTCLTYLLFDTFRHGSCSTNKELEERLQQNVFLNYAA
ncbi:hypothetical protein K505DRAFT_201266, partial [Melanomma pulvis-pyrius CBS 109.77]